MLGRTLFGSIGTMDLVKTANQNLEQVCTMFRQDLDALPEEAFTQGFGGTTRTVADIVTEVNDVNDYFGAKLRGEEPPAWNLDDGWVRAPEGFNKKADVIAAFVQSTDRLKSTVAGFSAEVLDSPIPGDTNGRTYYSRVSFLVSHLMYHSGQLNYIQTLLGDSEWHWK